MSPGLSSLQCPKYEASSRCFVIRKLLHSGSYLSVCSQRRDGHFHLRIEREHAWILFASQLRFKPDYCPQQFPNNWVLFALQGNAGSLAVCAAQSAFLHSATPLLQVSGWHPRPLQLLSEGLLERPFKRVNGAAAEWATP